MKSGHPWHEKGPERLAFDQLAGDLVTAARVLLDQVDCFSPTRSCAPTEMVGAVLPREVFDRCKVAANNLAEALKR